MATLTKIESAEQLDELFERSYSEPVIIFKHSIRCGISAHVLDMAGEIDGELNVVIVQDNRDLSDEIAKRTGHTHQSPQAFVIRDGKATYHATHYGISPKSIAAAMQ
jgi:bacillithiol system protein YtxJ